MKVINTINEVRQSSLKVSKNGNGRYAVIVLTPFQAKKAQYGVQFWTQEMIKTGVCKNTDNSVSKFVEIL